MRPDTGVVRPGTGVVRPGEARTGAEVIRPAGVAAPPPVVTPIVVAPPTAPPPAAPVSFLPPVPAPPVLPPPIVPVSLVAPTPEAPPAPPAPPPARPRLLDRLGPRHRVADDAEEADADEVGEGGFDDSSVVEAPDDRDVTGFVSAPPPPPPPPLYSYQAPAPVAPAPAPVAPSAARPVGPARPQPAAPPVGPHPGQPHSGQPHPGQPHPGQPHLSQPQPGAGRPGPQARSQVGQQQPGRGQTLGPGWGGRAADQAGSGATATPARAPHPSWTQRPMRRRRRADPMRSAQELGYREEIVDDYYVDDDRPRGGGRRALIAVAAALVIGGGGGAVAGALAKPVQSSWIEAAAPAPIEPVLPAVGDGAPLPTQAGITNAIGDLLNAGSLGGAVGVTIVDLATGQTVFDQGGGDAVRPASTQKILTAAAVLAARGPGYQIATRAVAGPDPGSVVIIGAGDPTLGAGATTTYPGVGRLDDLAQQVKAALGGQAPTRVILDSTLYTGDTTGPGWDDSYVSEGDVAPITALMVNGGRVNAGVDPEAETQRSGQPDLVAAQAFAAALGLPASAVTRGQAAPDAKELGRVVSPPIARLVEFMLENSDNTIAEMLARQTAIATNQPASFAGAANAERSVLTGLGVNAAGLGMVDGSGLSGDNQVMPVRLADVLVRAASGQNPQLRAIISGLPVAGYSGTLADRYQSANTGASAAGVVRAKTGTLSGVSSLAGVLVDASGRALVFAFVADGRGDVDDAEIGLDRVAAALAGCGC